MLWISTRCLPDVQLDITLETLGSLTRGIEVIDGGKHRIPSVSLLESFPYQYSIRVPYREINLASILEPVRQASVAVIIERFTFASEIQAEVVVDPGFLTAKSDFILARRQLSKSCTDLLKASDEYGVGFFFRNMGRSEHFFIRFPGDLTMVSQVPLALDIGHAHVNGCLPQFLSDGASRYLYLYDCVGISPDHHEIGVGSINFEQVAVSMYSNGAKGVLDMNSFRAAYNSIKILRKFGIG